MDMAYPASAYDADGPFRGDGALVGDCDGLFDGWMIGWFDLEIGDRRLR